MNTKNQAHTHTHTHTQKTEICTVQLKCIQFPVVQFHGMALRVKKYFATRYSEMMILRRIEYLNAFLHGDQIAAFLIVLVSHLAFLVMKTVRENS